MYWKNDAERRDTRWAEYWSFPTAARARAKVNVGGGGPSEVRPPAQPQGELTPWLPEAQVVLNALRAGAVEAARDLARGIPEHTTDARVWRRYVDGELARVFGYSSPASVAFRRAATMAEAHARQLKAEGSAAAPRMYRLAALAYQSLGDICLSLGTDRDRAGSQRGPVHLRSTNLDRIREAYRTAYTYRMEFGSPDEQLETVSSLAILFAQTEHCEEALQWCQQAVRRAEAVAADRDEKLARIWVLQARVLTRLQRSADATAAAKKALAYSHLTSSVRLAAELSELLGDMSAARALSLLQTNKRAGRSEFKQAWEHLRRAVAQYERMGEKASANACRHHLIEIEPFLAAC
ncbi:hypothetical protein ACFL59_05525 [Planctomycetota bacterium]